MDSLFEKLKKIQKNSVYQNTSNDNQEWFCVKDQYETFLEVLDKKRGSKSAARFLPRVLINYIFSFLYLEQAEQVVELIFYPLENGEPLKDLQKIQLWKQDKDKFEFECHLKTITCHHSFNKNGEIGKK